MLETPKTLTPAMSAYLADLAYNAANNVRDAVSRSVIATLPRVPGGQDAHLTIVEVGGTVRLCLVTDDGQEVRADLPRAKRNLARRIRRAAERLVARTLEPA